MAEAKKRLLTYAGLKAIEDELENLKVVKRKEVAGKIKEAREQGDLSENAEYDAAKDEQRDIEARIEELEAILKNAEVVVEDEVDLDKINVGCAVKVYDITFDEEMTCALSATAVSGAAAPGIAVASALALSLGMGLQNFPEGAAISLPLRQEGFSKTKSFALGALSGIVEPIGGILAVLIAGSITPLMPWFLSFAAGAMIYVVVEELIPEAHLGEHSNAGTIGVLAGFVIMMILDVALG